MNPLLLTVFSTRLKGQQSEGPSPPDYLWLFFPKVIFLSVIAEWCVKSDVLGDYSAGRQAHMLNLPWWEELDHTAPGISRHNPRRGLGESVTRAHTYTVVGGRQCGSHFERQNQMEVQLFPHFLRQHYERESNWRAGAIKHVLFGEFSMEGEIMGSWDERWGMCKNSFLGSTVGQYHLFRTSRHTHTHTHTHNTLLSKVAYCKGPLVSLCCS